MNNQPWIKTISQGQTYQGLFACQICPRPPDQLQRLKWGFNAAALILEAFDRQRLFIESQHTGNVQEGDPADKRSLALRCIHIPGSPLLLSLVGKICASSEKEAERQAALYCREILSIFPYDYLIYPAITEECFHTLMGIEVLQKCTSTKSMAQILRFEMQQQTRKNLVYVMGFWQGVERSDEQIWRSLNGYPGPALLNILLRPTSVTDEDRQALWDMIQTTPEMKDTVSEGFQPYDQWDEPLINKRLSPWKRFFYLQVHLACPENVSNNLIRDIGSAITRESPELLAPGFKVKHPSSDSEARRWMNGIAGLEILPGETNTTTISRLSDIADLNEAQTVFRFPYQIEPELTGISFQSKLI